MTTWTRFVEASRVVWRVYASRPLLYCASLFVMGALSRGVTSALSLILGGRHRLLEGSVWWLICLPLGLLAEVVLAKMYLERREDWQGLAVDFRAVLRLRQLLPLLARLSVLITLWFVVAGVPALLLALVPPVWRAVVFGIHHPGVKLPPSLHHSTLGFIAVWLALVCALVSRYCFVLRCLRLAGFQRKRLCTSA